VSVVFLESIINASRTVASFFGIQETVTL